MLPNCIREANKEFFGAWNDVTLKAFLAEVRGFTIGAFFVILGVMSIVLPLFVGAWVCMLLDYPRESLSATLVLTFSGTIGILILRYGLILHEKFANK